MINKDRIVPVTRSDLLSLYGTMLKIANVSYAAITAADGTFTVSGSGAAGNKLCAQPAVSINFGSGVTSGTAYFVADYAFDKIYVNGAAATLADAGLGYDDLTLDAATLYTAALSSGEVTIAAISPAV